MKERSMTCVSRLSSRASRWTLAALCGLLIPGLQGCQFLPTPKLTQSVDNRSVTTISPTATGPFYWTGEQVTHPIFPWLPSVISNRSQPARSSRAFPIVTNDREPLLPVVNRSRPASAPTTTPPPAPFQPESSKVDHHLQVAAFSPPVPNDSSTSNSQVHPIPPVPASNSKVADAPIESKPDSKDTSSAPSQIKPPTDWKTTEGDHGNRWPSTLSNSGVTYDFPDLDPNLFMPWRERWRKGTDHLLAIANDPIAGQSLPHWNVQKRLVEWIQSQATDFEDSKNSHTSLKHLFDSLDDLRPLEAANVRFCREVRDFGSTEPMDPNTLAAGKPVLIYSELLGLKSRLDRDHRTWQIEAVAEIYRPTALPDDKPIYREVIGQGVDHRASLQKDVFMSYRMKMPESLAPGKYRFRLIQNDLIGKQTVATDLEFQIQKSDPAR